MWILQGCLVPFRSTLATQPCMRWDGPGHFKTRRSQQTPQEAGGQFCAQVPVCFARAVRIVWRIAPRVGDESFWFFIVACWCALTTLSQGRLVEGKVGGAQLIEKLAPNWKIIRKVGPLLDHKERLRRFTLERS